MGYSDGDRIILLFFVFSIMIMDRAHDRMTETKNLIWSGRHCASYFIAF